MERLIPIRSLELCDRYSMNAANLTPELVEKIRELYNSGRSQQSLSDEFNLNRATVHSILNNLI